MVSAVFQVCINMDQKINPSGKNIVRLLCFSHSKRRGFQEKDKSYSVDKLSQKQFAALCTSLILKSHNQNNNYNFQDQIREFQRYTDINVSTLFNRTTKNSANAIFCPLFQATLPCQAYPGLGCHKPHLGQAGERVAVEYKIRTVSSVPAGGIQENKFLCYINPSMALPM